MEYDFIVIGAGSAGCVLANRLSADPARSVLVLEAGGSDRNLNVRVPAAFSKLFKTNRDWDYATEPEPTLKGRELYVPRGKMLGGSSSMNAMIYIRGRREDYDGWAASGCEGWSYDQVLPYFKRSENNERIHDEFHGVGGDLNVADLRSPNPLSEAFVDAAAEWGLSRTDDFNGASQFGTSLYQVTQKNGRRWSAADAFLKPVMKRENLTVRTGATVTRINLTAGRATSVEFVHRGERQLAQVTGEVVVSAGAINSPQILMLSGIGPADHLRSVGLEPLVDLPVGERLQDHPAVLMAYESLQDVGIDDAEKPKYLLEYMLRRRGKLTSNVGEAGAFLTTRDDLRTADIQFHFAPTYFNDHGFVTRDGFALTFGPTLISVKSRGRVLLRSADPTDKVRIEGNYLDDPEDMRSLVAGVRIGREIAGQSAFNHFRGAEIHPGSDYQTDAEIEAYIRQVVEMLYHPTGTCAMGPAGSAVVDPQLRVNGVSGLRVADASVMPEIVGGNTNAPTIMIAEKAADLIWSAAS